MPIWALVILTLITPQTSVSEVVEHFGSGASGKRNCFIAMSVYLSKYPLENNEGITCTEFK